MEWAELHECPGDDRRPQEMTVVWMRLFGFSIVDVWDILMKQPPKRKKKSDHTGMINRKFC